MIALYIRWDHFNVSYLPPLEAMLSLNQTSSVLHSLLGHHTHHIRGPLPENFQWNSLPPAKTRVIQPTVDVLEVIEQREATMGGLVSAILDLLEPGFIIRLTRHPKLSDEMIRMLMDEIHKELYEVVPIKYMIHYPQDGIGKTYKKSKQKPPPGRNN